jgi:glutathione S-transferase
MTNTYKLELVSFDLCPYVQRSVIMLKHKKVEFKITYIDLANPPDWFNRASPLGKVPLLFVRPTPASEPAVLFESAIINEYIDETTPPALLPRDPLEKARERAWVAVSGELFMMSYALMNAADASEKQEASLELWETLAKVEEAITGTSTFSNTGFSLADAAFAPFFMRMLMMKSLRDDAHWKTLPKTRRWADALLAMPEVRDSVIPDFKQKYAGYLQSKGLATAHDFA